MKSDFCRGKNIRFRFVEKGNECVSCFVDVRNVFVVSNGGSSGFPYLLLRILIRRVAREPDDLDIAVLFDVLRDHASLVPSRIVQEERDLLARIERTDLLQDVFRNIHGLEVCFPRMLLSRLEVEESIDVPAQARARSHLDLRILADWKPHFLYCGGGREHHLVSGEYNGIFFFEQRIELACSRLLPHRHLRVVALVVFRAGAVVGERYFLEDEVQRRFRFVLHLKTLQGPIAKESACPMFVAITEVLECFFLHRLQYGFSLPLGEQFFWFSFSFVGEAGDSLFQVSLFERNCVRARETGQCADIGATTPPIGQENRLSTHGFVLYGCGFDECTQFRNLFVVEPFYV